MFTIYTPKITSRIAFIVNVIFKEHLNIPYRITDSISEFEQISSLKISYASQPLSSESFFWQHPLLLEEGIREQEIKISDYEGDPVFFQSPIPESFLPFDLFAWAFYLITRYEEYLPRPSDRFGRFPATESIAFKAGFLDKPLIDILILKTAEKLQKKLPGFIYQKSSFQYIASYDIDNAYAYKHKGFIRITGGLIKQFLQGNFKETRQRIAVLRGKTPDPFDNYDFMEYLRSEYRIKTYFFILFAGKSKYDRGLSPTNRQLQKLIRNLSENGIIGIHPSFASHSNRNKLVKEIKMLSGLLGQNITAARSHFLLLDFPGTYQNFLSNGIADDFTLGYADLPGFRAATSKSFLFFDLKKNEETALRIHPFAYMDKTLYGYLHLSPEKSLPVICKLTKEVKSVGGTCIALWHNDVFGRDSGKEWRAVYEKSIRYAIEP